ncbi:structural maintenance of chromosomes protein 2-1-like [Plasmopara halstedii]|uniref:Structural maintenance of chromosomes protein 2-1-like n=1 Tax=Plasmopara halstedii TaxID=4781 RepID=A0A0N7L6S0_PLAHL|nr:structural maintenance of chromosomes protein 2-1-like [Plasmopara halstedii]CEG45051.1 structural maintenance of chromosomes protein 2-1-like [Plasmopara halstedii]|eukprot:XP_024581420.1 structural maintenance of chromosomes protein 2-1-like [Plasmopara halstedii]
MQGRITKVLNMKPPEILGMIEEAAGTRMYENKKIAALKTMTKKEKKVDEINSILANEITPTLEKLRAEKTHYLKWAANNTEMERLQRFCVANEYQNAQDALMNTAHHVEKMQQDQRAAKEQEVQIEQEIEQISGEIDALHEQREKKMGKEFQQLKENVEKIGKEVVKFTTKLKHCKASIEQQVNAESGMNEQAAETEQAMAKLARNIEKAKMKVNEVEESFITKEAAANAYQRQIQALNAGMEQSGDNDESLSERLASKQRELQENNTAIKQINLRLKHMEESIKHKRREIEQTRINNRSMDEERKHKLNELEHMRAKVDQVTINFNPDEESGLHKRVQELQEHILRAEREVDEISSGLSSRLDFKYTDPYRNFHRESVMGVLANLLETKHEWSALALEIAAGGKLYQIVVDNEKTAKDILKFGRLMNRVTIIPLNRISRQTVDRRKMDKARQVAHQQGGKVWEAMELIQFKPELLPAMEYAFGSSIICDTSELAKNITFHREIKIRTVTLDGDSYDPAGTLQGGSAPSSGTPILLKLHQLINRTRELSDMRHEYQDCSRSLDNMKQESGHFRQLKHQIELKKHELSLLDERIAASVFAQLEREVASSEDQYAKDKELLVTKKKAVTHLSREVKDLDADITNLKDSRQSKIGVLEKRFVEAKKEAQSISAQLKAVQQELSELVLELESAEQELAGNNESVANIQNELAALRKEEKKVEDKLAQIQETYEKASQKLEKRRSDLSLNDQQLKELSARQSALSNKKSDLEIERKKAEHKISRMEKDENDAKLTVKKLEKAHPWIDTEKEFFGREHTDYDFKRKDPSMANRRLLELKETQGVLSKKINKKVMGMIEKAEQEYQGLMNKRHIIENDKEKITSVIKELDAKKNEALKTTWVKVNKDFGSIFGTLLPGTHAKLDPPKNGTILDGLQVRVSFGGVWKESLTELSGGQRSLLALSLILSLLLFKPAPMYILDEVDAALDLSHTQNIGQMIRSHFSHSQFVVVSLKEGMFNNANVVFRTKFVDGVSTVTRTVPKSRTR